MPNWCQNEVVIKHRDPAMIERAAKAYQEGKFFQEFIPCPQELLETTAQGGTNEQEKINREKLGYTSWYDFNVANWGTKWDIGGSGEYAEQVDANTLELRFDSAWSPPIEGYRALEEMGFEIEAYYNEPGMAFAGCYAAGAEDSIDYSGWSADQIRTEVPHLDERFCISEYLEEVESEQQEE